MSWPNSDQARSITRELILQRINKERDKQLEKWGEQKQTFAGWVSIAAEELGEAAQHANTTLSEPESHYTINQFMLEMIQLAAVCVSACEDAQERYDALVASEP